MADITDPENNPVKRVNLTTKGASQMGGAVSESTFTDHLTNPVVRGVERSDLALSYVGRVVNKTHAEEDEGTNLSTLLHEPNIQETLLKSHIFIFGRVGFFDRICENLKKLAQKNKGMGVQTLRTETQLDSYLTNASFNPVIPLILIPAARNKEALNALVTKALDSGAPIWVVSLPSQIEKQLLLAFNCFFVSKGPDSETSELTDITPISHQDLDNLKKGISIEALFAIHMILPEKPAPNRMGTVILLSQIESLIF